MVFNLEFGKRRHSGQLLSLPETFQGIKRCQGGRRQRLLQKYKNLRLIYDEENQTYMIAPEDLEFEGTNRRNKQYCVVVNTLNWRDGDDVDLLISREINGDLMVIIKGF